MSLAFRAGEQFVSILIHKLSNPFYFPGSMKSSSFDKPNGECGKQKHHTVVILLSPMTASMAKYPEGVLTEVMVNLQSYYSEAGIII